jgi:hypothetical protein
MKFYQTQAKKKAVKNVSVFELWKVTNLSPFIFRLRFHYDLLKAEVLTDVAQGIWNYILQLGRRWRWQEEQTIKTLWEESFFWFAGFVVILRCIFERKFNVFHRKSLRLFTDWREIRFILSFEFGKWILKVWVGGMAEGLLEAIKLRKV